MKKDAGCDENMDDDEEEERRDWNEGVHVRVDDERVERGEGTRGGLEEDAAHGDEEDETACKTPTAVRGGAGGFPFGAGWVDAADRVGFFDAGIARAHSFLHAFADATFSCMAGVEPRRRAPRSVVLQVW
jgi:hypothetical protein